MTFISAQAGICWHARVRDEEITESPHREPPEHGCTEVFGVLQQQTLSAAVSVLMPDVAVKEKWALGKCWI